MPGCRNPYLKWHHFDPPWGEKEHHNPEGMIALCAEHHDKADTGAFTKEQLHKFKEEGIQHAIEVQGSFDWMRRDILAVVGGNFYYKTPIIFKFRNEPIIWFNRDEDGYLLLNLRMLTTTKQPRAYIEDNFWISKGNPTDLQSPPSGKLLRIDYENGDHFQVEFIEAHSISDLKKRYGDTEERIQKRRQEEIQKQIQELPPEIRKQLLTELESRQTDTGPFQHIQQLVSFPITVIEVRMSVGGTDIKFGPRKTTLPNKITLQGCAFSNFSCAIHFE